MKVFALSVVLLFCQPSLAGAKKRVVMSNSDFPARFLAEYDAKIKELNNYEVTVTSNHASSINFIRRRHVGANKEFSLELVPVKKTPPTRAKIGFSP